MILPNFIGVAEKVYIINKLGAIFINTDLFCWANDVYVWLCTRNDSDFVGAGRNRRKYI